MLQRPNIPKEVLAEFRHQADLCSGFTFNDIVQGSSSPAETTEKLLSLEYSSFAIIGTLMHNISVQGRGTPEEYFEFIKAEILDSVERLKKNAITVEIPDEKPQPILMVREKDDIIH